MKPTQSALTAIASDERVDSVEPYHGGALIWLKQSFAFRRDAKHGRTRSQFVYSDADIDAAKARIVPDQPTRQKKDAARYIWLRDWAQFNQLAEWFNKGLTAEQIDAKIDEAIATRKP